MMQLISVIPIANINGGVNVHDTHNLVVPIANINAVVNVHDKIIMGLQLML